MEVRVAVVVAVLVDVLDLVGLVAVDQADAETVQADVAEPVLGVEDLVLAVAAGDAVAVVRDAREDVKDAPDALGAEDHVLPHVHLVVKVAPAVHAMVVPGALVHVLHVHQDVEEVVLDALDVVVVQDVQRIVTDAVELVVVDAVIAVVDVQADVVDVQGAVLDAMAHVLEHAMDVVMDAVVHAKTHVLLPARRHALEHAKLKRLAP